MWWQEEGKQIKEEGLRQEKVTEACGQFCASIQS